MKQINDSRKIFLSIVMVARNDDYGGHFIERLNFSLSNLVNKISEKSFRTEVIIIEWNPPNDRPNLKSVINVKSTRKCSIRIIIVNPKIHRSLPSFEDKPVIEFVAKNTGIRRAHGKYILCTTPDILFSPEILSLIEPKYLESNSFYRTVRYDVKKPRDQSIKLKEVIDYCRKNVTDVFDENHTEHKTIAKIFPTLIGVYRNILSNKRKKIHSPFEVPFTKASGDFLMMKKERWNEIGGYPEIKGWYQIDGLAVYQATFLGLNQVIFRYPAVIYHIEHERIKYGSARQSLEVLNAYERLINTKKLIKFNKPNWGLKGMRLPEYYL